MGIVMWIVLGALTGWVASLVMRSDRNDAAVSTILIGISGALIGGYIGQQISGGDISGYNQYSIMISIFCAVGLLLLTKLFRVRA